MINGLKTLTVNIVAGANVATVLLLILAGYADHINPARFPMLSSMGMTFPVFLIANLLFLFFWRRRGSYGSPRRYAFGLSDDTLLEPSS